MIGLLLLIPLVFLSPLLVAVIDVFWWIFSNQQLSNMSYGDAKVVAIFIFSMFGIWSCIPVLTIISESKGSK